MVKAKLKKNIVYFQSFTTEYFGKLRRNKGHCKILDFCFQTFFNTELYCCELEKW
jgi:hypothetical protein